LFIGFVSSSFVRFHSSYNAVYIHLVIHCGVGCWDVNHVIAYGQRVSLFGNVQYFSYGGFKTKARDISVMYQIPFQITLKRAGDNDGIVSVASSKWGKYVRTLNADHLEQIGWETSPLSFVNWIIGYKTFHAKSFYVNELLPLLAEVERKYEEGENNTSYAFH
jgi:hypothetical protein